MCVYIERERRKMGEFKERSRDLIRDGVFIGEG
jgi:hypothetical protein